ncbi:MAG: ATP-binding protein [Polyangiaceae bacterium]
MLAFSWWYAFALRNSSARLAHFPRSSIQLIAFLIEAAVIVLILRRMERACDILKTKQACDKFLRELGDALVDVSSPRQVALLFIRKVVGALGAKKGVIIQRCDSVSFEIIQPVVSDANECDVKSCRAEALTTEVLGAFDAEEPSWSSSRRESVGSSALNVLGPNPVISTVLSVPMRTRNGRKFGVLVLEFASSFDTGRTNAAWLMELGKLCAGALERASSRAEESFVRSHLQELSAFCTALGHAATLTDVARLIVEFGVDGVRANTCALYVSLAEPSELELIASNGVGCNVISSIKRIDVRQTAVAFANVDDGGARWVPLNEEHRALAPLLSALPPSALQAQSFGALPLIVGGRTIGLLALGFAEVRGFTKAERIVPEIFAQFAADALFRVRMVEAEERVRRLADDASAVLKASLDSIDQAAIVTDANDRVTVMNPVAEDLTGWQQAEASTHSLAEVFRLIDELSSAGHDGSEVDAAHQTATSALLVSRDGRRVVPVGNKRATILREDGSTRGHIILFRDAFAQRTAALRLGLVSELVATLGDPRDYRSILADVARLSVPRIADWVSVDLLEEGRRDVGRIAAAHGESAMIVDSAKEVPSFVARGIRQASAKVIQTGRSLLDEDVSFDAFGATEGDAESSARRGSNRIRSLISVPLVARGQTVGAMSFAIVASNRTYGPSDLAFAEVVCGLCSMVIDNGLLRSAERVAKRSAELASIAKDEFLATVSHELRTPLNAIMGWSRLLSSPDLDATRRRRGIETIERNSVAMARLIEDILDVSRIISGKMRLALKVVNLSQVVEAAIESVRPAADAKSVTIAASLDDFRCPILGDPARIQQIVWNLLSNAVKFNTPDGRVEVGLLRSDSTVEIRVTDTGRGIHPNFLPHVFEPFRQAESGYARGRSGLGLGLAIARQLTELHGGSIDAASDGEGRGATFWIRLPIPAISRAGEAQTSPGHRRIASQPKFESLGVLRGLRVLVVDDDDDARILVKTVLEQCGSVVKTGASVAEGITEIARECPELVISDIGMPGEDGYDFIRRIRNSGDPRVARVPAAALTAFVRTEDRQRMLRAGYGMHIPKPVEPAELVSAIARLLRGSAGEGKLDHVTDDSNSANS